MSTWRFEVRSDPKPQPRARARVIPLGGGKYRASVYDAAGKSADWRADVVRAIRDAGLSDLALAKPLSLSVDFSFRRPRSHYGTGRNAGALKQGAPAFPVGKQGDLDNLVKGLMDAMIRANLLADDCYVVALQVIKRFGEKPGAFCILSNVDDTLLAVV